MPPPVSSSSSSSSAAAAQQQAEAARQRAAAAQQKAAADKQAAQASRTANQQAQTAKTQASKELSSSKSHLDSLNRATEQRGPRGAQVDQLSKAQDTYEAAKVESKDANATATKTQKAQTEAESAAKSSRQTAVDTANKALDAEKTANVAAKREGKAQPYEQANQVKDVFDAGSLNAKDQEQLFGAKSVVTPAEAGQADAKRVSTAAGQGPKQGAAELDRQLQQNSDPAYRSALMDGSKESVDAIGRELSDPKTSQTDANDAVKSLASAAEASGPEGRTQIASSLGKSDQVNAALKANAGDESVVALGGAAASHLRQTGDYAGADAITELDPKFQAASPQTQGEQQARDAVDVTTVGEERSALEKGSQDAREKNAETAERIFDQAGKDQKDLPPGVEVVKGTDPNRAELVARNEQGEITAQTVAIRDGDQTTIEKTTYEQGRASFTSSTTSANGDSSTTAASWKAEPSKTPQASPDIEALKNSRDPDVQVQQQSVRHDGDSLVSTDYAQGKTGITQTTKTYLQQSKDDATHSGDGIKDDFEGQFSDDQPVDVVNTRAIAIPAGGEKGEDGKQAVPQVSESATFSQGETRLQRTAGTHRYEVDGEVPSDFQPAASDLATEPQDLPGIKEGDEQSVQWTLEKSSGNTYDAQTYVEGQDDLQTTTHREATGSSVTETVSGKVPSEEEGEDPVEISSKTEQTFAKDGSLAQLHKDDTAPDGTHTVTDFSRTTNPGPNGLDISEHLNVQRTDADGETYGIDRKTESRLSNEGVQLLSSDETVTGPDGTTGRTRLDETGTKTFVNGAEVNGKDALAGYSETAQRLVSQSGADTFKEAQGYINNGGVNAVKLLGIGSKLPADGTTLTQANNALNQELVSKFGQQNVDTAFRIQAGAVGGLTAAGGLAGVVSSTGELVDGIRDQDFGKIATGLVGDISNGAAIKNGGKAFLDAVKGLSPEALSVEQKAVNTALRTSSWLSKVPGLSSEAATAGGVAAGTASKFLNKLGGPAAIAGVAISGYELYKAIDGGNGYQIAQASVGLAGAGVVGAIAIGAAVGSIGPGVGTLIGAGVGLAAFGVQQLIGMFDHSETDIADVTI